MTRPFDGEFFEPVPSGGKVTGLREAIERLVAPGDAIYATNTHGRPNAAIFELARVFAGRDPRFTWYGLNIGNNVSVLAHLGLIPLAHTCYFGDTWPTPGPSPVINRAWKAGKLEIRHWSIATLTQRLAAAARGVSFSATASLAGSSMAVDNAAAGEYLELQIPDGEMQPAVTAFAPDVTFIHAWAADENGNAVLTPPYGEWIWGAAAARKGAIVTAERIVSAAELARYQSFVQLPAYTVAAVCCAPLGSHPTGLSGGGIPEANAYADDYEFLHECRRAGADEKSYDAWVREWVFDTENHEGYLRKLGRGRIWQLKGKADGDSWMDELRDHKPALQAMGEANETENMIAAAARLMAERVKQAGYRTILAGIGASNLVAWLAHRTLRDDGYDVELIAELGFYGYEPRPADPFIFNYRNIPACKGLAGISQVMDIFMGGANNQCLGSLGAGQIDKGGNINTTVIPDKMLLVGSGGNNDIAGCSREVMVTIRHGKGRLVENAPYVTSPGANVSTVVTNLGLLRKSGGELKLAGYFERDDLSGEEIVELIRSQTGWDLQPESKVLPLEKASVAELELIRAFDPLRQFLDK